MIIVRAVAGVATVQDAGRPGHMHEGVPPGGALVPELLARANVAAGNTPGEAAIEVFGSITLAADGPLLFASDDGERRTLSGREDDAWTVRTEGARVRYLAARGGIDVPRVLGGRGTLLGACLGGLEGRPLRRGDTLATGAAPAVSSTPPAPPDLIGPVPVVLGPDLDRFPGEAAEELLSSTFVVDPRSDRVGLRLHGPRLARVGPDDGLSAPMVLGAIQVPPSGDPVVLGPDHPTTGGYPVLATVVRGAVGALFSRPLGARVRFVAHRATLGR